VGPRLGGAFAGNLAWADRQRPGRAPTTAGRPLTAGRAPARQMLPLRIRTARALHGAGRTGLRAWRPASAPDRRGGRRVVFAIASHCVTHDRYFVRVW